MAIDIKTLHIGSHVEYDGKRVCVDEICTLRSTDAPMRLIVSRNRLVCGHPSIDEIEPIPITPDLLKELGFKWRKDSSCWLKYENYDGVRFDWGIYAYGCDNGTWCFSLYLPNFLIKPQLYAEHLHEIEGQLAYYGVELIKE